MTVYMARSTSSVWGSATSHVHDLSRRFKFETLSEPGSRVSLEITSKSGQAAQITGSRDVVCKTPAEYKANKLNRNEQTKLENVTFRVVKEKEITRRKFTQSERMLRAKSAKIAERIQSLESSSYIADRPMSYAYEKRPPSEHFSKRAKSPSAARTSAKTNMKSNDGQCKVCELIQRVIQMYEKEGKRTGILEEYSDHSTCLFSDVQMRTFVHMLEAKYFSEIPDVNSKLRESGILSRFDRPRNGPKLSREEINNNIAKKNVEMRIQQFCKEVDHYKKSHAGVRIPKEVQDNAEKIRLENAVLFLRQTPAKHEQIRREVEEILGL
ncbi:uncharacterized protein LOC123553416 [Mercenaria mercenaria]|uniref:uncharacterized protein LOC123553416 n=1 Tax=Mercenaria mercenaria TaxID=6596 RepID=UPI00234F845B|nr:uncharacterized protein LOC123553416 [Mercenaria mercenaria]